MKKAIILLLSLSSFLTYLYFLPLMHRLSTSLPNSIDPLLYAWNLNHNAHCIFQGVRSCLNTTMFYPETNTLALSDTLLGPALLATPIIYIWNNPILAENISIYLTFPLAALSMFFLCFYLTRHTMASFFSSLLYAFCYPRMAHLGHLPMISSHFLPLFFLFILQYFEHGRVRSLMLAMLTFLLLLISSMYFIVFSFPFFCIVLMFYIYRWNQKHEIATLWTRIKTSLPYFIPFTILVLILMYPYILLKIENPYITRSLFVTMDYRAFLMDYFSVLPTSVLARFGFPVNINERALYPTLTLLSLSIIGIIFSWKKHRFMILLFISTAISSFILSFGIEQTIHIGPLFIEKLRLPYYYLYQFIPIFQLVRVPSRFSIFFILSLTVLASYGIMSLCRLKYRTFILITLFILFFLETIQINMPYVQIPSHSSFPPVYKWLQGQSESTIIAEVPIRRFYAGSPMSTQLMLPYYELTEMDNYAIETYRLYFSILHNKRSVNGYSGFFPQSYVTLTELGEVFPTHEYLKKLKDFGVSILIIHSWQMRQSPVELRARISQEFIEISPIIDFGEDWVYKIN